MVVDNVKIGNGAGPDVVLDNESHLAKTIARILETNQILIHGFEPTEDTFVKLQTRFKNSDLVKLHDLALSDKHGEATFHCNSNEQTDSLLDNDEGNDSALPQHTRHVDVPTIQTAGLDDWFDVHLPGRRVIIKSDVQGAEGLLLAGGMETFGDQVIGFYSEAQTAPMCKRQMDFWWYASIVD